MKAFYRCTNCALLSAFGLNILFYSGTGTAAQLSINNNPYAFSGYYRDTESGLCYLKARYYSPESASFTTRDSYDIHNRRAYCDGNPVTKTDPSGHDTSDSGGDAGINPMNLGVLAGIVIGVMSSVIQRECSKKWMGFTGAGLFFITAVSYSFLTHYSVDNNVTTPILITGFGSATTLVAAALFFRYREWKSERNGQLQPLLRPESDIGLNIDPNAQSMEITSEPRTPGSAARVPPSPHTEHPFWLNPNGSTPIFNGIT